MFLKRSLLITLTSALLWGFLGIAYGNDRCEELLSSSSVETETEGLMAYLGALLEHQIIGDAELVRFIKGLEKGKLINPISEEKAMVSSAALIHEEGIQEYLDLGDLNKKELLEWSKESLREKKRVWVKREETRKETQDVYQKIEFLPVGPGRFLMGEGKKVEVTLTNSIEVMSTQVTQKQWVEIMGENPSRFSEGKDSIVVNIKGGPVRMRPDHPVEEITWWSVLVFANRLSEKNGLKPAYDLDGVKFKKGTRAENGTLEKAEGEVIFNKNYYLSEGYRLPTEAEQEYLLRAGGKSSGEYHFGDKQEDLQDHAWYDKNSANTTHPVGELTPLVLEGQEFYDVHGNVGEWGMDSYYRPLSGGNDPQPVASSSSRVFRGGSWHFNAQYLRSAYRRFNAPEYGSGYVGFRLVRTR